MMSNQAALPLGAVELFPQSPSAGLGLSEIEKLNFVTKKRHTPTTSKQKSYPWKLIIQNSKKDISKVKDKLQSPFNVFWFDIDGSYILNWNAKRSIDKFLPLDRGWETSSKKNAKENSNA